MSRYSTIKTMLNILGDILLTILEFLVNFEGFTIFIACLLIVSAIKIIYSLVLR